MRRLWSPRRLRRKLTLRRWKLAKTDAGQVQFAANDPQLGSLTWQSSWQPVAPRRGWPSGEHGQVGVDGRLHSRGRGWEEAQRGGQ